MSKETQIAYDFIVGNEHIANAMNHSSGASITIFQFDSTPANEGNFKDAVERLTRRGYHGYYFFTGKENRLYSY